MPNVESPADLLLSQDVIFVGGGSVANQVAVWRVHGLDSILRQAWEAGVVLSGVSAGAICWFAGGTTDSFGPALQTVHRRPGAACRAATARTTTQKRSGARSTSELVGAGTVPPGVACDDGAAAHYLDDELAEIVVDRPGAQGYLVYLGSAGAVEETALKTRLLRD